MRCNLFASALFRCERKIGEAWIKRLRATRRALCPHCPLRDDLLGSAIFTAEDESCEQGKYGFSSMVVLQDVRVQATVVSKVPRATFTVNSTVLEQVLVRPSVRSPKQSG